MEIRYHHTPGPLQVDPDSRSGASLLEYTDAALESDGVYTRALHMGRFRFAWTPEQRRFLAAEVKHWTVAHCLSLGERVVGVKDRLLWELPPLEQAALCRFRGMLANELAGELGVKPYLRAALGGIASREHAQEQEYRELAMAVQRVTQGRDREIHLDWFADALFTQAASQRDVQGMKIGLLALARLLTPVSP
ncbi:MAG: hypothetical protein PVJ95_02385 [Cellvibrionales bacterium]